MVQFTGLSGARILLVGAMAIFGGPATADQVIADDLIVQGSICAGFDCVNNEAFGADGIVIKENNTRLLFNDTSTLPGFPANDWRLLANDSFSGGANFFAIEDATAGRQVFQLSAGARANSIFVSPGSAVGFGTSTPVLPLHVARSDTPGLRLEQDASGGFPAQTWDVSGNDASFFVRDFTNSQLPFRIRPGAPTSSIDINSDGNVGIGTTGPAAKLEVAAGRFRVASNGTDIGPPASGRGVQLTYLGASDYGLLLSFDNSGGVYKPLRLDGSNVAIQTLSGGTVGIGTATPTAQFHTTSSVRFGGITGCGGGVVTDGAGNVSCLISSRQFKTITGALEPTTALANVMALRPQVGAYTTTPDVPEHWLIAEDVAAVDPALAGFKDGAPYTVKTQNVVADLVAVIQQQQARIEALEKAIAR